MLIPVFIFALMLLFPGETKSGAYLGLTLWFDTIIPTLLPYIIITNIINYFNAFSTISSILYPITGRILKISPAANYCVIVGFFCGYPMGSKVIADMLNSGNITEHEANYLMSFCNNASPSFIINYVAGSILLTSSGRLLIILLISPVITGFIYRIIHKYAKTSYTCSHINLCKPVFNFNVIDNCIIKSFETIIKIGGYIILFSIVNCIIINLNIFPETVNFILASILEITSGLSLAPDINMDPSAKNTLVCILCSFGGLCSVAQTSSMITGTGIKIFPYIKYKIINMAVTFLLCQII